MTRPNSNRVKSFVAFLGEERMNPAAFSLTGLYHELNHLLFADELQAHPIKFGRVTKRAAGVTNAKAIRNGRFTTVVPGSIFITISPYAYELDTLKGIVAHEMIHAYLMQVNRNEREAHGPAFMAMLYRLNKLAPFTIPLNHTMEDDERGAPKPVAFIAAMKDGKQLVGLYAMTVMSKPDTTTNAQYQLNSLTGHNHCTWAVFGTTSTRLAGSLPLKREVTKSIQLYGAEHRHLGMPTILLSSGNAGF